MLSISDVSDVGEALGGTCYKSIGRAERPMRGGGTLPGIRNGRKPPLPLGLEKPKSGDPGA